MRNMNLLDRRVRGFLVTPAVVIVALVVGMTTPVGILLLLVAVIMAVTAAAGFCPLYRLAAMATGGHRS